MASFACPIIGFLFLFLFPFNLIGYIAGILMLVSPIFGIIYIISLVRNRGELKFKKLGIFVGLLGFLISICASVFAYFLLFWPHLTPPSKDARIISNMAQLRTRAELSNEEHGSYTMVGCNMSADAIELCNDIGKQLGASPVSNGWPTFATSTDGLTYCAYAKVRTKYQGQQDYYCIELRMGGNSTTANIDCTAGGVTASCGNLR